MSIQTEVIEIIGKEINKHPEGIKPEHKFIDDLGVDSLDFVEAVMALEEHFKIDFPETVFEDMSTVGELIKYINEVEEEKEKRG